MLLSRKIDDKEIQLKNQQKAFFQISGAGHEAVPGGRRPAAAPGYDWFFPYYRDRALCLALGMTPLEMFLASVGSQGRPGQRRPPDAVALGPPRAEHPVAEQLRRHAVPARRRLRRGRRDLRTRRRPSRTATRAITRTRSPTSRSARARTSEGEFWESLNTACTRKLPVLYPGRRQRLRDLGAGGSADARRRHLAPRRGLPRPARLPLRRHRLPRQLPHDARGRRARPRAARARRSCTPPSSGRTRTRSPTTRSCTRRRASARPRRGAIRCVRMRQFLKTRRPGHRRGPGRHRSPRSSAR